MSEIQLSCDLNVITAEINSFKQVAGQAIFEIGRRLKHVKENDLVHGEWIKWLESIDFSPRHAQRFIKVTESLGENATSMSQLGIAVMYEIATLPPEEREKEHTLSNGETKPVNEMTVRELQEVKQALREAEQVKMSAIKRATELEQELRQAKRVTKTEDSPETVQRLKDLERQLLGANNQYRKASQELEALKLRDSSDFDEEEARKQREKLQHEAHIKTADLRIAYKRFVENAAIGRLLYGAIGASSNAEKQLLTELVEMAEQVIYDTKLALSGRKEIDT